MGFFLRIANKSMVFCRFVHIYLKNPWWYSVVAVALMSSFGEHVFWYKNNSCVNSNKVATATLCTSYGISSAALSQNNERSSTRLFLKSLNSVLSTEPVTLIVNASIERQLHIKTFESHIFSIKKSNFINVPRIDPCIWIGVLNEW